MSSLPGGRVAFGVLVGSAPKVLVFDDKGVGEQKALPVKKALTETIPKDKGRREIHRVTGAVGAAGGVVAYVDSERVEANHRVVACGTSEAADDVLRFDGKPLLALDEDRVGPAPAKPAEPAGSAPKPPPPAPAPSAKPPATPPASPAANAVTPSPASPGANAVPPAPAVAQKPATVAGKSPVDPAKSHALLKEIDFARMQAARKRRAEAVQGVAAPVVPSVVPPHPPVPPQSEVVASASSAKPKGDKQRELRDCRSITNHAGAHAFTVGSELVAQPLEDGTTDYAMELFVLPDSGRGRVTLHTAAIGKAPTKLPEFEAPIATDLGNGEFALSTRFRGSLFAWMLDADERPRGPMRVFPGGSPGAPRFSTFGPETALLVVTRDADHATGRALLFEPGASQLPAMLSELRLADLALTGPISGVLQGGTRFVAVQADDKARRLVLVPVDATLSAFGAPVPVDGGVFESRVAALSDGRLLLVYLRGAENGKVELVSRTVKCG